MKKAIPSLKVNLPSYPDWKQGIKWGVIWGAGAAGIIVASISILPPPPSLDGKTMSIFEWVAIRASVFFVIFIGAGLVFGILASFRPPFRKKTNPEKEEKKRTKSLQRTEYRR
jgi:hypothetical protein